jgi:hypothetical protein
VAFGQSSGPPATGKQVRELLDLLHAAGHSDFRDARGPMGFTQRQAGGKFTRDEADEFIERLEATINGDGTNEDASPAPAPPSPARTRVSRPVPPPASVELGDVPTELLAAELQRRGWVVLQP